MPREKITTRTLNIEGAKKETRDDAPGVEVFTYEVNGVHYAYGYRSPKTLRHDFHHRYRDADQRDRSIAAFFDRHKGNAQYKAKKAENRKLPNPFKERDVLVCSWGYDQTNVEFYQVVGVKGKTVVLREIGQETVNADAQGLGDVSQSMAEYVVARRDVFKGEPFTKLVQFSDRGNAYVKMTNYSTAELWDGSKKYQSHYA